MEDQSTAQQVQKVALPAYLPKRMQAFRLGKGDQQTYLVRDKAQNRSYDFEPWQFFVLEVLPDCEDIHNSTTDSRDGSMPSIDANGCIPISSTSTPPMSKITPAIFDVIYLPL